MLGKEVEVLKKLKLAIFGVQAKSDPSTTFFLFQKSSHGGADPTTANRNTSSLAAIHSIMVSKVVGGHLPLLEELIIFPEGKFTHHQLANNHVAGSTLPDGRYPTAAFNSIHPRTLPPHLAA
eukprot:scaffold3795_cov110-Skeletonema_marinoi.AAC.2